MRSGWVETTLGEVTAINPGRLNGVSPDEVIRYVDISSVSWDGGIDVRSVAAMPFGEAPGRARRPINEKDVVVSTVRPRLRAMGQVPPSLAGQVASTGLCVLRSHDPQVILPDYVWQVVRHQPFTDWLVERETGSNYPAVRSSDIEAYRFPLPPIEEQRRIVDLMSHIDEMVEAARTALVRSETLAQALRDRLPPAPEISLGQVVRSLDSGRSTTAKSGPGPDQEMLTLAAIRPAKFRPGGRKPVGAAQLPAQAQVHEGDLLITRSNTPQTVGYACIARGVPENLFMPDLVWRIVPDEALVSPDFLEQLLASTRGRRLVREVARGTSQSMRKINKETFRALRFPIPSLDVQSQYLAPLREVSRAISTGEEELGRLNDARSTILHALVSGGHAIPPSYDGFIRDEGAA